MRGQTLARPGWAGSGMTVERWWPHAVLCAVDPASLRRPGTAAENSTFQRLTQHLDDLQALGVDAVLLQGLEAEAPNSPSGGAESPGPLPAQVAASPVVQIEPRYGTLDEFDDLVREAARHGMRVLVELRAGAHGSALTDDARFWLNHGATGVAVGTDDPGTVRALRSVLRGYVGERVLIGPNVAVVNGPSPTRTPAATASTERVPPHRTAESRGDQPDLLRVQLASTEDGAAAMRASLERARALINIHAPVPLISAAAKQEDPAALRALAAALLGSGGAVLLRADDLDVEHAADPAGQSSVFAWYRQWSGLHRGNAVMRAGEDTLLDHDADGALVWVRQVKNGGPPIVVICNVTNKGIRLSLVNEIQRLGLRGSFLRTLARSDGGMGAMPLREIVLPPFAVYAGQLSR